MTSFVISKSIHPFIHPSTKMAQMTIRWLEPHKQQILLRRQQQQQQQASSRSSHVRWKNWVAGIFLVAYLALSNVQSLAGIPPSQRTLEVQSQPNILQPLGGYQTSQADDKNPRLRSDTSQQQPRSWIHKEMQSKEEWILSAATTTADAVPMTVILLWDGQSYDLLAHVIRNLDAADYDGDRIDLYIPMLLPQPTKIKSQYNNMDPFFIQSVQWSHGEVRVVDANSIIVGTDAATTLPTRIRQIWQPNQSTDHVMMFHVNNHSNQHPKASWYQWYKKARQRPLPRDVAGLGLSNAKMRRELSSRSGVLSSEDDDYYSFLLFPTVNMYSGLSPLPSVWKDFIEYAGCMQQKIHGDKQQLFSIDNWEFLEDWWNTFVGAKHLFHLYQFPSGNPLFDNADTWSDTSATRLQSSASLPTIKYIYDSNKNNTALVRTTAGTTTLRTAVMSVAVGYPLEYFEQFVGTLRQFYRGDVWLAVGPNLTRDVADYLQQHDIQSMVLPEITGSDGEAKARDRFTFFEVVCNPDRYDLCLHTDFRDSIFQDDPFGEFYNAPPSPHEPEEYLHIYYMHGEQKIIMNPWHFRQMAKCGIYDAYGRNVAGRWIVNSGSFIATPGVYKELGHYHRLWKTCNDQVVYNTWVYTPHEKILPEHQYSNHNRNITMHFHRQGEGAIMNIVAFADEGGFVEKDSQGRFLNRNCLPSPVVHRIRSSIVTS
jgi:hypothetical protein